MEQSEEIDYGKPERYTKQCGCIKERIRGVIVPLSWCGNDFGKNILINLANENGDVYVIVRYNNGNYKYDYYNINPMYDISATDNYPKKIFLEDFEEAVIIKDNFLTCANLRNVKEIDLTSLRNVEHIGSDFLAGLSSIKSVDLSHMTKLKTIGKFVIR